MSVQSKFLPLIWARLNLPLNELNPIFAPPPPPPKPLQQQAAEVSYWAADQVAELLRLVVAKDSSIRVVDFAVTPGRAQRDSGTPHVVLTLFRSDGTSVQAVLQEDLARLLLRDELLKNLWG